MFEEWDNTERLRGEANLNGESLGECYVQLTWNRFKTSEMSLEVLDGDPQLFERIKNRNQDSDVIIKCNYWDRSYFRIVLDASLSSYSLLGFEKRASIPVKEFKHYQIFDRHAKTTRALCKIDFPLCVTTDYCHGFSQHEAGGLFRGKYNYDDQTFKVDHNPLEICSGLGNLVISDRFEFPKQKLRNRDRYYPSRKFIRESLVKLNRNTDSESDVENSVKGFEHQVEKLLKIIGFAERNRYDWKHASYKYFDENNDLIRIEHKYKRMLEPIEDSIRVSVTQRPVHELVSMVWDNVSSISTKRRNNFFWLLYNIGIANLAHTIEDSLVRWHSCLDFFRQKMGNGGRYPSGRILTTVNEAGIDITDLIEPKIVESIENAITQDEDEGKTKFEFTRMRDDFIHQGFDSLRNEYDQVMVQNRIMRALVERLVLSYIGIDYRDTYLGTTEMQPA